MLVLNLYKSVLQMLAPLIKREMLRQGQRRRLPAKRIPELWGQTKCKSPSHVDIWGHAVSVGEVKSLLTLFHKIAEHLPETQFLITTTTPTAAKIVEQEARIKYVHQYLPFDVPQWIKAFLDRWKPQVAFVIEQELWPNLIRLTSERNVKMALINGRLTDRSCARWKMIRKTAAYLLDRFEYVFAQSPRDQENFETISHLHQHIHYVGNLKLSAQVADINQSACADLQGMMGNRPFWVAASLHPGEEPIALEAHKMIRKEIPDLLTIIVPRHPRKLDIFTQACAMRQLSYAVRSEKQSIEPTTEVYLADTIGELANFYYLSEVSLIGGSLIEGIGGHNPIEAAVMNTAILMGPHTFNFSQIHQDLEEREAVVTVHNAKELAAKVVKFLKNEDKRKNFQMSATQYVEQNNPIDVIYDMIEPMLLSAPFALTYFSKKAMRHEENKVQSPHILAGKTLRH